MKQVKWFKVEPKKDVYRISSDSAFAPFEFQNEDNEYVGIDVDLLTRAAEMQGFNIEFNFMVSQERYKR